MSDEWVDEPQKDEWVDEGRGEWVDEAPKPEEPGIGTRALQILKKINDGRAMGIANSPEVTELRKLYSFVTGKPNDRLISDKEAEEFFTTWEGGVGSGELMKRAGVVKPENADMAGLAFDILAPGDPLGMGLGKVISKSSDLFRAAGLRNLLARIPWRQRAAALKVFKEEAIAGTVKNQAHMAQGAVDAAHHAVNGSVARATGDGLAADSQAFMNEANAYLNNARRTAGPGALSEAEHFTTNVINETANVRPKPVSLDFINQQRKAIGSTANPHTQKIREMLRARLVKDAGKIEGQAIDQGLKKEALLIMGRNGAESAANRAWSAKSLAVPVIGASLGAGRNMDLGDDFSLGAMGSGALRGALLAKGITSPWFLTRGAQAFEAASPYLGRLGAQGIYRQLPKKEKKNEEEKDPWAGEEQRDPWSGSPRQP